MHARAGLPPRKHSRLPRWAIVALLPTLFLASLSIVVGLCVQLLSTLAAETPGSGKLQPPLSLAAIHQSTHAILSAGERHPLLVASAYASLYVFFQSWGVPGAFLLNALGGALFGTIWGTLFNDILCVTGASFKYLMSREFGSRMFASAACSCVRFEERIRPLRARVDEARKQHTLLFFLISLRVFPGMPHWALNLAAPHAGVPLPHFVASTLIGMLPYIAVTVRAGAMLSALPPDATAADVLSWPVLGGMAGLAAAVLALALLLARFQSGGSGSAKAAAEGSSELSPGHAARGSSSRGTVGSSPAHRHHHGPLPPPASAEAAAAATAAHPHGKGAGAGGAKAFRGGGHIEVAVAAAGEEGGVGLL